MSKILFTSESVTEGHPDKICDQISDSILDALLEQDPMSRVACETAITTGLVLVMGEITSSAAVDYQKIVRDTIQEIGYDDSEKGFDCSTCGVMIAIDKQSADIALGVDASYELKEGQKDDYNLQWKGTDGTMKKYVLVGTGWRGLMKIVGSTGSFKSSSGSLFLSSLSPGHAWKPLYDQ